MDIEQRVKIVLYNLQKCSKEAHAMFKLMCAANVVTLKTVYKWLSDLRLEMSRLNTNNGRDVLVAEKLEKKWLKGFNQIES